MLAASVAVGLVALVGASDQEPVLEAVPAAQAAHRPAPGIGEARNSVREAFGGPETTLDADGHTIGVYAYEPLDAEVLAGDGVPGFDPFNAPTPEVFMPGEVSPAELPTIPLPTAPASIPTSVVETVEVEETGTLLSQPVNGRSTSRFGLRFHPVLHVTKLHTGHDWAAPCGTPVGATAAGTVVRTGWAGGNGVQVKIDHGMLDGYRVVSTYNHLSAIGVQVGQKVTALQGIGRVGNTGYSTGCHLHFELIVNGQFTDPIPWLNGESGIVDLSKMGIVVVPSTPGSPTALPSSPFATDSPTPARPGLPDFSSPGIPSPSPSASSPGLPSPSTSPSPSASTSPSASESPSPTGSPTTSPSPSKTGTPTASAPSAEPTSEQPKPPASSTPPPPATSTPAPPPPSTSTPAPPPPPTSTPAPPPSSTPPPPADPTPEPTKTSEAPKPADPPSETAPAPTKPADPAPPADTPEG